MRRLSPARTSTHVLFLEKGLQADLQRLGDAQQGRQRRDHLLVFYLRQQRLGQAGRLGKILQGHTPFLAQAADFEADEQPLDFFSDIFH
jgi:hypothetical protein